MATPSRAISVSPRVIMAALALSPISSPSQTPAAKAMTFFIAPPSWKELERRLKDRGTDDPEKVQKRLLRAKVEFQTAHTYDYFVINDTVEDAVRELDAIITAEHCKPKERMSVLAE